MLKESDLTQFYGTENWYQHPLMPMISYTDGAKYVADEGDAYWLLDTIAGAQYLSTVRGEEVQVWKLTVKDERGTLTCDDGDGNIVYMQDIPYTDFPLPEIKFYFVGKTIMLTSEY